MFCCLTASTGRALLCIANAEFGIQVIVEAVMACPEPEHRPLYRYSECVQTHGVTEEASHSRLFKPMMSLKKPHTAGCSNPWCH